MAKKKGAKHHKRTTHRRRRMGAAPSNMQGIVMTLGGAVLAKVVTNNLPDTIGGFDLSKFKPAVPILAGYFLPSLIKNPIMVKVGEGMMIGGGLELTQQLGLIGALGDAAPFIAAYDKTPLLNAAGVSDSAPMVAGKESMVISG